MRLLYANQIIKNAGITEGIVGLSKTVVQNLHVMYNPSQANAIIHMMEKSSDGAYFFDQFCQFVVFVQNQPGYGLSMRISDYHGSIDAALDEYNLLRINDWEQEDRDKIMKIVHAIEGYSGEFAQMVIKDAVESGL